MVRVRLRYGHWIPRALGVEGIVLYPFVLFRRSRERTGLLTLQHEMIHVRQVRSRGFFFFYGAYAAEYLRGRARGLSHQEAYAEISFEREAYGKQAIADLSEEERREIDRATAKRRG